MPDGVDHEFAITALRRCALFAKADDSTLDACAAQLRVRRFRRAETIFHQGDPGDSLFVIEDGAVKIVLPSPEGEEAAIIATLGRGDFFGELALLDGAYRSATAVAVEPTATLVLRREPFELLIDTDAGLRHALFAGLATELRRGEVRLPWPFTQSELAAMIGGTRQTVNRLLADFVERDLIRFEKETLVIPSVDLLARAAER
jgi:CRP/FNR family cyclic AMP-dependent transcriptional regulator